jgi:uncharacterized protein with HEPN domain
MKSEKARNKERLLHILEAANKIVTFTHGVTKKQFLGDEQKQGAVLFQFSIIGEAINNVDAEILNQYDYPWHEVRAFRNIVAHEYFGIRIEKIWSIVINNLPELKIAVEKIIQNEF